MANFLDEDSQDFDEESSGTGIRRHLGLLGVGVASGIALLFALAVIGPQTLMRSVGDGTSKILAAHRPITMLEHSGAVLLNASNLKNHISLPMHGTYRRWWIGPITGSKYATDCVTPGILKVSYFRANANLANATLVDGVQPFVTVTAYQDSSFFAREMHPLTADQSKTVTNSLGDLVAYDATALTRLVIHPKGSNEIITLKYSTPQSVASALIDAQNLVQL